MSNKEPDPKSIEFIVAWSEFNNKCQEIGVDYRASVHLFGDGTDKHFMESSQPVRSSRSATVDLMDNGDVRVLEHRYDRLGVIGKNYASIWHNQAQSTTLTDDAENIERYFETIVDAGINCRKD